LSKTDSFDQMETFRKHERTGQPLGCDSFVQNPEQKLDKILRPQKTGRKTKLKVRERVSDIYNIKIEDIYSQGRQKLQAEARDLFCYWAVRESGMTCTELANRLEKCPQNSTLPNMTNLP